MMLEEAIIPFVELAKELLSIDGRNYNSYIRDTDVVFQCKDTSITIRDCKILLKVTEDL